MRYEGIIFDLDGVICSTDKYHYQAWQKTADNIGVYFDEKINDRLRGVSRMESLEIILEKDRREYSIEEKEKLADQKNELYVELLDNMTLADLSDDVRETLVHLREKGLKLAIGSSSKNTKRILQRIGLADFFDAVSDGTNITRSKPDPEVFLKAADYLELLPSECLVVEDAAAGVEAAVAGGFACAGVGAASAYEKVTYSMEKFSDLLKIAD